MTAVHPQRLARLGAMLDRQDILDRAGSAAIPGCCRESSGYGVSPSHPAERRWSDPGTGPEGFQRDANVDIERLTRTGWI